MALGLARTGQTLENLRERGECVLNFPSPDLWREVDELGRTTGRNPVPSERVTRGIRSQHDKFAIEGFTPCQSTFVAPVGIAECPLRMEGTVVRIDPLGSEEPIADVVQVHVHRVTADERLVIEGDHIDTRAWQPLIYNFATILGSATNAESHATLSDSVANRPTIHGSASSYDEVSPMPTLRNDRDVTGMLEMAIELCRWGGDEAVARLDADNGRMAKGDGADVVTQVDHAVDRHMIRTIQERFPDHVILSEESGTLGPADAPFTWMIDPLDGTNNYVMGLPMFGVCVTLIDEQGPVLAVIHESVRRRTSWAVRGAGAWRDGAPLRMTPPADAARTTVSWTQGYPVRADDPFRVASLTVLERAYKRVLHSWSPSIDWGLIAEGHIGAYVAWRNERWDVLGGVLLVEEAGGVSWTSDDGALVIAGHPDVVEQLRAVLPSRP